MAGKQAKILSSDAFDSLLAYASSSRYPLRNAVIVLLSVKAGLRAGEIAKLTWPMILTPMAKLAAQSRCTTRRPRKAPAGQYRFIRNWPKPWKLGLTHKPISKDLSSDRSAAGL